MGTFTSPGTGLMVLASLNWLEYALDITDPKFLKSNVGKHLTVQSKKHLKDVQVFSSNN